MGELGGFMKIHRVNGRKRPIPERVRDFKEYIFPAEEPVLREQGARCMDCGIPFCHDGCPLGQPDPGLERPRLPRPLAGGDRGAPRDEQLPRVHGPDLPGAVRGLVRARHQRRRGHDQADRAVDHRPRVGGGLGQGRAARGAQRQVRRRHRLRPGRARRRSGAEPLRPQRHAVRAQHARGRPAALRCPRLQAREVDRAAACRPDRRGGGGASLRRRRRQGRDRRRAPRAVRRDRDRRRLDDPARPARSRTRAGRRPLRDGLPRDAQPLGRWRVRARARRSRRPASTW